MIVVPLKDLPRSSTEFPLYDTAAALRALNCSRWKLWHLCRNDPEFPKPRLIAGKNQWFVSEVEEYKATRPRRIYATIVAVVAVVSIALTALFQAPWA